MHPLRDLSIRFKLAASLVAVASVVLLLSTIAGLIEQHQSAKSALASQISALADLLGDASNTALQFEDQVTADEVLASLRRQPRVVFAQTFDIRGQSFAKYKRDEFTSEDIPKIPADQESIFQDGYFHVIKQIGDGESQLGTIYVRASMERLYNSLQRKIILAIISLVVCLGIAVLLGYFVHRVISRPILRLAAATERVSRNADFSVRVAKHSNDELGVLCDGFNTMLDQIQQRDRELEKHRTQLEDLVQKRTSSLQSKTEELTVLNDQLLRSNQELDDFAYIVSHDLKEPLRGISRYSSFLAEDYADKIDADGRDKLDTLQRLCQRQENLIDSLLQYSRVGRAEFAIRPTDLNECVAEVLEMMHVMLHDNNVDVRIPRPLPTVNCDSVRIVEVFRNLITNAVKYNDKPQQWVEIGFKEIEASDTSDDAAVHKDSIVFYIRDNGIGIRDKHQDSVFRIFKRLHARDKFGGGTGAGLTFVKKILERHGGRVWLESTYGEGTTFYFTIGLHPNEELSAEPLNQA
ncbi:MAG: HAMP domain-containing protein [Pirellulaceae bacterium]|nr:HAMP domain-containing protein [Pirellulaceae bacterium]